MIITHGWSETGFLREDALWRTDSRKNPVSLSECISPKIKESPQGIYQELQTSANPPNQSATIRL